MLSNCEQLTHEREQAGGREMNNVAISKRMVTVVEGNTDMDGTGVCTLHGDGSGPKSSMYRCSIVRSARYLRVAACCCCWIPIMIEMYPYPVDKQTRSTRIDAFKSEPASSTWILTTLTTIEQNRDFDSAELISLCVAVLSQYDALISTQVGESLCGRVGPEAEGRGYLLSLTAANPMTPSHQALDSTQPSGALASQYKSTL